MIGLSYKIMTHQKTTSSYDDDIFVMFILCACNLEVA